MCVLQGWVVQLDSDGKEFFQHVLTGQTIYEHPLDEHYRQVCRPGPSPEGHALHRRPMGAGLAWQWEAHECLPAHAHAHACVLC